MMVLIDKLSKEEQIKRGIPEWPIWTKEVSRFDWYYEDEEHCQILEGEVLIESAEGNYSFKAGDFVIFRKGFKCVWNVIKPVRKHYKFL